MLERRFLLRFVRTGLEISSGFALNVGATFATGGQLPLAAVVTGAAAALLAAKATVDHVLSATEQREAEEALNSVTARHGSLPAAIQAIADNRETGDVLSAEKARTYLELASIDAEGERTAREDQEALIVYIGQWLDQWCTEHGRDVEDFRQQFTDAVTAIQSELLRLGAQLNHVIEQNEQGHAATQQLIKRIHPFQKPDDYFLPFLDPSRIFRHDWILVGRHSAVEQLVQFAKAGPERICIVPGRGGVGKSKLLHAVVEQFRGSDHPIFFAHENIGLAGLTGAELPPEGSLLVVDDAHRYEDLPTLLDVLQAHRPNIRVLLVTRPHAVGYLRSTILNAKYDITQLRTFAELRELPKADVKALAEQALGERFRHLSDMLVDISWDSPLVTVVAGQLVAREAISPTLLERKHDFRDAVLSRFQDELLGQISPQVPARDCVGVLQVLSAIAPSPISDQFIGITANFLQLTEDAVRNALNAMEVGGILLRRGQTLRVTPDVLADHVLFNACVQRNEPTHYAERVFSTYFELYPAQVLRNLAELDWRVREAESAPPRLLDRIWQQIENDYKTAPYRRQCEFLRVFREIGYLEPDHVLNLVEYSIRDSPTDDLQNLEADDWLNVTSRNVRRLIPGVLRNVAFRIDYLPRCCDLLWYLGRDDSRPLAPNPDHAIRILESIAKYGHGKPLAAHNHVLERALNWLKAPDVHDHAHSVFDVLDPLLAKSAFSESSTRTSMIFHPFLVDRSVTQPLRHAVIEQLKKAVMTGGPETVKRALKSLQNFLLPPTAYFGHPIAEEDVKQWEPEQIDVLEFLVAQAEACADIPRKVQILASIPYYIRVQSNEGIRERIRRLKRILAADHELQLARRLLQTSRFDFEDDDDEEERRNHDLWRARKEAQLDDITRELLTRYPAPDDAFQAVDSLARRLSEAGMVPDAWDLFRSIGKRDPSYSLRLAKRIFASPESPLFSRADILLSWSRQTDPSETLRAVQELISSPTVLHRRLAAYFLGSWCTEMSEAEVAGVERLLVDPDPGVQDLAIASLVLLRNSRPSQALRLALSVDFRKRASGAEKLCEVLMKDHKELHEGVTNEDLEHALHKLINVDTFEGHHLIWLILAACTRVPNATVDLLLSRVRNRGLQLDYRAFPYSGELSELKRMASVPNYGMLLRRVRDALYDLKGAGDFWIPKLFAWLSGFFAAPESIAALSEWADSGRTDQIVGTAQLVCEGGRYFAFSQSQFVALLLERAFERGEDCYESVRNRLFIATIGGQRHGVSGEPYPQDIQMRDKAAETAKLFDAGSRARQFYEAVEKQAKANIARAIAEEDDHDT